MICSASLISFHPSWGLSLDYQGSEGDHNDTILVNGNVTMMLPLALQIAFSSLYPTVPTFDKII